MSFLHLPAFRKSGCALTFTLSTFLSSSAEQAFYPSLAQCTNKKVFQAYADSVRSRGAILSGTTGAPYRAARTADLKQIKEYFSTAYAGGLELRRETGGSSGKTLLHHALDPRGYAAMPDTPENRQARLRTVDFLLEMGANVNTRTKNHETPLQMAVVGGLEPVVRALLKNGAEVNGSYAPGAHPVQLAAASGNTTITKWMLDAGANINPDNLEVDVGETPLGIALRRADVKMTKTLIAWMKKKHGKGPWIRFDSLLDPLVTNPLPNPIPEHRKEDAERRLELAKLLLASGHQPRAVHAAVLANYPALVKLFLDAGGNPNLGESSLTGTPWHTPLHDAVIHANLEIIKALLAKGANLDAVTRSRKVSVLHCAILPETRRGEKLPISQAQRREVVKFLLKEGARPGVTVNNWSALHLAVSSGDPAMVKLMLEQDADVNAATRRGYTPLHINGYPHGAEIAKMLIKHGAKIETTDKHQKRRPIHMAAARGEAEVVVALLEAGADRDVQGHMRKQPIHYAAQAGQVPSIAVLLEKGARLDVRSLTGYQPLHYAARHGWPQVVRFLLAKGADPKAVDKDGNTALDLAKKLKHPRCVEILEGLEVN